MTSERAEVGDVFYVRDLSQAMVLLKPLRLELLRHMGEPRSCPELAQLVGETTQKAYYHVKALESARLVEKISERRVGGIMEGLYRARGRSYWLAPELVGRIGGDDRARDELSLGYLLSLAEQLQEDLAHLAMANDDTPSMGLSAEIVLAGIERRDAFLTDVETAVRRIAERYGATTPQNGSDAFRLVVACYPHRREVAPSSDLQRARGRGRRSQQRPHTDKRRHR